MTKYLAQQTAYLLSVAAFFLGSVNALAGSYSFEQLKSFVEKKKSCSMTIGGTFIPITQMDAAIRKDPAKWPLGPYTLCVADMTSDEGTIKEKSGCGVGYLNIETGRLQKFNADAPPVIASKLCKNGGFDELLKLKAPANPYDQFARFEDKEKNGMVPVSVWLTDFSRAGLGLYGKVLLYSESKDWTNWWTKERKEVEDAWAKTIEKQEKEEAVAQQKAKSDDVKPKSVTKAKPTPPARLEGKWAIACEESDGRWVEQFVEYKNGTSTQTVTEYQSAGCNKETFTYKITGIYKTGPTLNEREKIQAIDTIAKKVTMLPHSEEAAQALTGKSAYGVLNWVANQAQDVSKAPEFREKIGRTIYSIYRLDGNTLYDDSADSSEKLTGQSRNNLKLDLKKPWKRVRSGADAAE